MYIQIFRSMTERTARQSDESVFIDKASLISRHDSSLIRTLELRYWLTGLRCNEAKILH